jgi:hypothetical protein
MKGVAAVEGINFREDSTGKSITTFVTGSEDHNLVSHLRSNIYRWRENLSFAGLVT